VADSALGARGSELWGVGGGAGAWTSLLVDMVLGERKGLGLASSFIDISPSITEIVANHTMRSHRHLILLGRRKAAYAIRM